MESPPAPGMKCAQQRATRKVGGVYGPQETDRLAARSGAYHLDARAIHLRISVGQRLPAAGRDACATGHPSLVNRPRTAGPTTDPGVRHYTPTR